MEEFTIYDGLILTIVSMVVVMLVLAAIWGLVELVSKFIVRHDGANEAEFTLSSVATGQLTENPKHKRVAEIMALILASEDQSDKKFEIVESKRVK